MKSRVSWIISVVCLMIFCLAGSLGAVVYRYQDLSLQGLTISGTGSNPASINAINDSAWIVGKFYDSSANDYQAFVWRPGLGRTTLQNPRYFSGEAAAHGINNQGQIVGRSPCSGMLSGSISCYWSGPSADPEALPVTIFSLTDYYNNCAYGINEGGQVAGSMQVEPSTMVHYHAVWWSADHSVTDLGTLGGNTSTARGINDAGWVVGDADNSDGYHRACIWASWLPGQQPIEIVTLPPGGLYSSGVAINTQGNVVGVADLTPGLGLGHAFFWNQQTGAAQDICPTDYESFAYGISDANQVIGSLFGGLGAFYWTPGSVRKDLNDMVVNLPAGVTLSSAKAISRNGRYISGFDSQGHPYLLTASAYVPITMLLLD
jgi:hypothetical protein